MVAMVSLPTNISATEAARRFSDLLNRVRYKGESFVIVRNGEPIARLERTPETPQVTLDQLLEQLPNYRTGDPDFAEDLERIRSEQPAIGDDPWET
jgi:antitoxin (DNA-binding transcriptional repressor) of toxin-antitoxin stability system